MERLVLGRILTFCNSTDTCGSSILQESDMSILDVFKSLQNKGGSVTGAGAVPSALTSTKGKGLFDTSENSVLGDTALTDIELGEQVEQLEFSVPTLKTSYQKSTKGYIVYQVVMPFLIVVQERKKHKKV